MRPVKNGGLVPKTEALPGWLQAQRVRCGRSNCHCATGLGHGPYWYRRWRDRGRQRRQYVKPGDLDQVRSALAEYNRTHARAWSIRCSIRELNRLCRLLGV